MAGLPRKQVSISTGIFEWWPLAPEAAKSFFAPTLVELVKDILGCLAENVVGVRAGRITVARDNPDAIVFVHSGGDFYRVTYDGPAGPPSGLRSFASISEDEMRALADLLKPDSSDGLFHTVERPMPSSPDFPRLTRFNC